MPRKQINIQLDFFHKNKSNLFEVKQFDDISLEIDTFMNNLQFDPRGGNCRLYVGISNDMFLQEENILLEENKILVKLDRNIVNDTGQAYAEIELSDDEGTITSTTFTFNVVNKIGEGATIPEPIEGFVAKYERLISEFKLQVNETINNCDTNVDNKLNTVDRLISVKISDFEKRFNTLTSSQQQDAEVVLAREDFKGNVFGSLKERIDYTDKLLRDSTVSTVETESNFTVVEATSNGYFDDIKLEGKTLVNIVKGEKGGVKQTLVADGTNKNITYNTNIALKIGKEYTFITNISKNTLEGIGNILLANSFTTKPSIIIPRNSIGVIAKKIIIGSDHIDKGYHQVAITSNITSGEITFDYYMILEGDHTQNPPAYFEGLKSVGDGTDEIIVESVNENLFDISLWKNYSKLTGMTNPGSEITWVGDDLHFKALVNDAYTNTGVITEGKVLDESIRHLAMRVLPNTTYTVSCDVVSDVENHILYLSELKEDYSYNALRSSKRGGSSILFTFTTKADTKFLTMRVGVVGVGNTATFKNIQIKRVDTLTSYTSHHSDKKRLLYYNEETQTWEKPVLREWDSVEKHSDGKYYYHQRSGEVVLNGSETIRMNSVGEKSIQFVFDNYPIDIAETSSLSEAQLISDTIPHMSSDAIGAGSLDRETFGIAVRIKGVRGLFITIPKSKLSTLDVAGFKKWLQANNVTVVYQLAEEKVYECTNIDLITYANETNYIIESGAIAPKSNLKVHNNISNVVSLLQKKVSLLESNINSYMITQNRLMLASRYNADTVSFKVDIASSRSSFKYDNDLYELILNNILIGKDNYIREYIENLILFYWMDFVISDEMYSTLFEIIEEQHNPKISEEAPL